MNRFWTKDAAKPFKKAERTFCWTDDKHVYISDGYVVYCMFESDYNDVFLPATKIAAGDWYVDCGVKSDGPAAESKLRGIREIWDKAVAKYTEKRESCEPLSACPFTVDTERNERARVFYSPTDDFGVMFNQLYLSAMNTIPKGYTDSPITPAMFFSEKEPVALICPMRISPSISRAVRAYFVENVESNGKDVESLEAAYKEKVREKTEKIFELENTIRRLESEKTDAQNQPAETTGVKKPIAEALKNAVEKMGLTATIKGASTKAPVVWIENGDAKSDDLKSIGALYSRKRKAFYICV